MKPLSGKSATVVCDPSEVKDPATVRPYPSPQRFWGFGKTQLADRACPATELIGRGTRHRVRLRQWSLHADFIREISVRGDCRVRLEDRVFLH